MIKGIFFNSPSGIKFILIVLLVLLCFFSSYFMGIVLVNLIFKINLFTNPEILYEINESNINIIRLFQLIQSFGLFIIPSIIISFLMYHSIQEYLRLNFNFSFYILVLSILTLLSFIPFTVLLTYMNNHLKLPGILKGIEEWVINAENKTNQLTSLFLKTENVSTVLYNILIMAIIPAVGEELLFRGVFQRFFTEVFKNIHMSVIFVSFLFAIIHLQFLSFLPRFFLGLLFGYMLELSGTMIIPIVLHFLNNFIGIIWSIVFNNPEIFTTTSKHLSNTTLLISIIGGITGILCLFLMYKKRKRFISF